MTLEYFAIIYLLFVLEISIHLHVFDAAVLHKKVKNMKLFQTHCRDKKKKKKNKKNS